MIEAVENHMPEVIVIDEIGTEAEALAARTIAERGVQLVGTAHGNNLDNLLMNPTLCDLVGGIHAVTLSDEEARRRGTQKTVLERKAPPTFDVVIEIMDINRLAIHHDVADVVDRYLRGLVTAPEIRQLTGEGEVEIIAPPQVDIYRERPLPPLGGGEVSEPTAAYGRELRIFLYGVSRNKLERGLADLGMRAQIVKQIEQADAVITVKAHHRRDTGKFQDAVAMGIPVHVVRSNTYHQLLGILREVFHLSRVSAEERALREAQGAVEHVLQTSEPVELAPQSAYLRRLQHQLANQHQLSSQSVGMDPDRRLRISK
jgi:CBS domain-containing protein